MKKSKLKMGLVTSFICSIALTACDVTANDDYIVNYKFGNDDSLVGLLTNNMYSEYLDTPAGLTKYYEKVRDLLVLTTFEDVTKDANGLKVKTQYETLNVQADNKVEEQRETARKNAKNNDTSYSDELDAILESHGVEDEEGLKQHFLLELEQEQLDSAIMDNDEQLKILRDGNGSTEKGWINSARPYHIKHMLVKVEGGADDFTRATITEDEATKLSKIVTLLGGGNSFDDLASNNLLNDDSSDKLGDVGIVNNNATSKSLTMVSEFQLGIYTADVKVNGKTGDGIGLDSMVKIDDGAEVKVQDALNVVEVPYSAFKTIGDYAKYPESTVDDKIKDINACVYPRNVLWNKYFNNHNVFVITNKKANEAANSPLVLDEVDPNAPAAAFNAQGYLAEDGKVIFGVRSEYGVHFIKIQKSAYDDNLDKYYPISLKVDGKDVTNVEEYGQTCYITGLDNNKGTYDTRLSDIKSAIKGYDSNSEYRLYNYLVSYAKNKGILKSDNAETNSLLAKIDAHIEDLKDAETYKQKEGLKAVWENYLRLIKLQNTKRADSWTEGYFYTKYVSGDWKTVYSGDIARTALVPETTAQKYTALCDEANKDAQATALAQFLEGGDYYYGK